MPIAPIITFKAGECTIDTSSKPYKITPNPDPGYVYLYSEDDLVHFCWRRRDQALDDPKLDLVMVPSDGFFMPYEYTTTPQPTSKTNGRIFVLKFASSSQRHLFWMQSRPQGRNADASYFSPRDRKIGEIVHRLLQGDVVNVARELASVRNTDDRRDDDNGGDEDQTMEDAEARSGHSGSRDRRGGGSGGAGADATGGDVREEGEGSREGGADGARAASASTTLSEAQAAVRDFLASLQGQTAPSGGQQQDQGDKAYPYLHHLLPTSITVPLVDTLSVEHVNKLLRLLPPSIIMMAAQAYDETKEPTEDQLAAALESLPLDRKQQLLKRVLRSPQFHQALAGLTMALRDGGLPSIAEALGVSVEQGGYLRPGIPLGGGFAVEAFIDGVKRTVQEKGR